MLISLAFLAFNMVSGLLFSGARLDLTEQKLYTISPGTKRILAGLDEPINLYFFYSDSGARELVPLRNYARRVEELLRAYEREANGRIRLQVIDPEPFSENEDKATEFGLQGIPLQQGGDNLYFGLAGSNALDGVQVIPIQMDVTRGVGILIIVFGHSWFVASSPTVLYPLLSPFILPLFFFISGVFFRTEQPFGEMALRKADALLKPFFVTMLGYVILRDLLRGQPLLPDIGGVLYASVDTLPWQALWYLPHFWVATLFAWFMLRVIQRLGLSLAASWREPGAEPRPRGSSRTPGCYRTEPRRHARPSAGCRTEAYARVRAAPG